MGLFRRGKTYWFRISYQGVRFQKSLKTDDMRFAEVLYNKALADIAEGKYHDTSNGMPMAKVIEKYMVEFSPRLSETSHERNKQIAKIFIPFFGNCLINEVRPAMLSKYKTKRLTKVQPVTVKKELTFLRRVFNIAIDEWELCKENPVKNVMKYLKADTKRVRFMTDEELQKLGLTLPAWLRPIIFFASQTGLRRNDIISLQVKQLHFEQDLILIPKTKYGDPVAIPMTTMVKETLLDILKNRKVISEYVFTDGQCKPCRSDQVSIAFKRACK
jgi:integrase